MQSRFKKKDFFGFNDITVSSAVIVQSSNLCAGPSLRTRISFFLLSVCINKLWSTPKITTFLPYSQFANENCKRASNQILKPLNPNLSGSTFSYNFTAPHKQLPSLNVVFKSFDRVSY